MCFSTSSEAEHPEFSNSKAPHVALVRIGFLQHLPTGGRSFFVPDAPGTRHEAPWCGGNSFVVTIVRPGVPNVASLLLVVRPGAPNVGGVVWPFS